MWNKIKQWLFSENASFTLAIIGFIILIGTITLFLANFGGFTTAIDSDKLDHFGSFIGGLVGAIWSLASFILLYVSLQEQKKALKIQETEISDTKGELEEQKKQLHLQRFETTYFNLIEAQQKYISNIIYDGFYTGECSHEGWKGKDVFNRILDHEIENNFIVKNHNQYTIDRSDFIKKIEDSGIKAIKGYFNLIENVIEWISINKNIIQGNEIFYIKIYTSQFSIQEIKLIQYYLFIRQDFNEILGKINFFDNVTFDTAVNDLYLSKNKTVPLIGKIVHVVR